MPRAPAPYASRGHRRSWRRVVATLARSDLATLEEFFQVTAGAGLIEAAHVQCPAGGGDRRQAPAPEVSFPFLDPHTRGGHAASKRPLSSAQPVAGTDGRPRRLISASSSSIHTPGRATMSQSSSGLL